MLLVEEFSFDYGWTSGVCYVLNMLGQVWDSGTYRERKLKNDDDHISFVRERGG